MSSCIKKTSYNNNPGFTILEIVAVLLIIGIIAAIAIGRAFLMNPDLMTRTEVIETHLRYAQTRAMNTNSVWGIRFDGDEYWRFNDGDINNRMILPGESSNSITLPSGMTAGTGIVSFDGWGRPCTDAAGTVIQVGDRVITVAYGGDSRDVTITQNTGFIP